MAGARDCINVNLLLDVGSPYSWLAIHVLLRYKEVWGLKLLLRPVLLGGVMKATGNAMPSRVPARGKWISEDLKRNAEFMQVPYKGSPMNFGGSTFNTMLCQRVLTAVAMEKGSESQELINLFLSFYKGIWGAEALQAVDLNDETFIRQCCLNAGFSEEAVLEYLSMATKSAVKERLQHNSQLAVEKGAFGTPTMFVYLNGHMDPDVQLETEPYNYMIFGSDRFEQLAFVLGKKWDGPLPSSPSRL